MPVLKRAARAQAMLSDPALSWARVAAGPAGWLAAGRFSGLQALHMQGYAQLPQCTVYYVVGCIASKMALCACQTGSPSTLLCGVGFDSVSRHTAANSCACGSCMPLVDNASSLAWRLVVRKGR